MGPQSSVHIQSRRLPDAPSDHDPRRRQQRTTDGTTDANDLITLPDITVAPNGGDSVFSASSTDVSASAPVTAPRTATAFRRDGDGNLSSYDKVPADSVPFGDSMFRAPNGDIYKDGKVIVSRTDAAVSYFNQSGSSSDFQSITTYTQKAVCK